MSVYGGGGDGGQQAGAEPAAAEQPGSGEGRDGSVAPATGALDRLPELDALPVHEHPGVYEDAHRRLQEALTDPEPER
ncbi:MAG: hypothetical protein M3P96_15395 [Actinomycetota bacterium]|nr:hypothetical protein [Actinomycetota bacterium]